LLDYIEVKPNPAVSEAIWRIFEALPSQTRPQRGAKPAKRLTALAHELASDDILPDAGKLAHATLHEALDAFRESHKEAIDAKRKAVLTVDGETAIADLKGRTKSFEQFVEEADTAVIDDAYRRAARIFSPDVSRTYVDHLANQEADRENDPEAFLEAIVEARITVAGLGLVLEVRNYFDSHAERLTKEWLTRYWPQVKALSDDRKESYRQIIEMSAEPQDVDLVKPEARYEATKARDGARVTDIPTWKKHLLCDDSGSYPAEMNAWERSVVETESRREGFAFWYRNPQQPGQSSLGIAYLASDEYRIVRPDFVFFATNESGEIVVDIVDPHGLQLADAIPKLRGLAQYAVTHAGSYRRIESVALVSGRLRSLNLLRDDVRAAIVSVAEAATLFQSPLASDYVTR
jgi:hypothetical protein